MLKESELKILNYLTLDPDGGCFVSQIARDIGMSKGEVSKAVKNLKEAGFVKTELTGRNMVCSVDRRLSVVAKLRAGFNLLEIVPKIASLQKCSDKIVLFGSCAQGADTKESDVDILVITRDKIKTAKIAQGIHFSRAAQWVIKTPQEYVLLNSKEPVFAKELAAGTVLWEAHETDGV